MQKISSYLYSNTIQINFDLAVQPTEWRAVYQRTVKIYKGYDNVIELDIKNAQQRRFDVSDKTLKCLIMDHAGQEILTSDVEHSSTPGLATFTVSSSDISYLDPQFLNFVVYVLNDDDSKNIIYGDTQFGALGRMELIGTATTRSVPQIALQTFTYLHDTVTGVQTFYSEAGIINPINDIIEDPSIDLEFDSNGLAAEVNVQITYDKVIGTATNWQTIETFNIASSTSSVTKTYSIPNDFTKEVNWLRITYVRETNNTGKFDRVTIIQ